MGGKNLGKVWVMLLSVFMFFSFVACKSHNVSSEISDTYSMVEENKATDIKPQTNVSKEEKKGVSSSQLEKDVSELPYVKNGIFNADGDETYKINSITIDKRQTNLEQKNDLIYCMVSISNSSYESNIYIKLTYNLYNEGFWSLDDDEYIVEKSNTKPLKCEQISDFYGNFKSFYICGIHEIKAENIQHIKDENLVSCNVNDYTYKQTSYYKITSSNGIFCADVSIEHYFSPKNGWTQMTRDYFKENYKIINTYCLKPDKIFGEFKRVSLTIGKSQEYLSFYNYNSKDNTVEYTYIIENNQKSTGKGVFDVSSMVIMDQCYIFEYDMEYDVWYINGDTRYDLAFEKN